MARKGVKENNRRNTTTKVKARGQYSKEQERKGRRKKEKVKRRGREQIRGRNEKPKRNKQEGRDKNGRRKGK